MTRFGPSIKDEHRTHNLPVPSRCVTCYYTGALLFTRATTLWSIKQYPIYNCWDLNNTCVILILKLCVCAILSQKLSSYIYWSKNKVNSKAARLCQKKHINIFYIIKTILNTKFIEGIWCPIWIHNQFNDFINHNYNC